jgi:hypothetical protein
MFWTKVVEEIKTQLLCSITFFAHENRAVYEIIWNKVVHPDRAQMTTLRAWYLGTQIHSRNM